MNMTTLTTGPFLVPFSSHEGGPPNVLLITLKNPTNERQTVTLFVERAPITIFPANTLGTTIVNGQTITLGPNRITTRLVAPLGNTSVVLSVTITGDIEKGKGEKMEASVVVASDLGVHDASTFFRHIDLMEADYD
jgi:hypothetical protein